MLLFHGFQKHVLFILCLIVFCAFSVLAAAAQPRLSEDTHPVTQPDIYGKNQEWAKNNKGYFKEYRMDVGSIIVVPKYGLMAIDSLKKHMSDKQKFFSERDIGKETWSIVPLLGNRTNSQMVVGITIGVIVKLRF